MNNFNVGDKVKCIQTEHPSWADSVMQVVKLYPTGLIECRHEKKGNGGFFTSQLVKVQTLEEQKQELLEQIIDINTRIADEKEKARLELGNKEVEIKLTLNELAWVVTNVGNHGVIETEEAMRTDAFLTEIPFSFTSPVVCGEGHYNLYEKLGSLLEQTVKDNM
jgi:putative lipoic acid-binding regulatory protein